MTIEETPANPAICGNDPSDGPSDCCGSQHDYAERAVMRPLEHGPVGRKSPSEASIQETKIPIASGATVGIIGIASAFPTVTPGGTTGVAEWPVSRMTTAPDRSAGAVAIRL